MTQAIAIRKLGREKLGHLRQIARLRVPLQFHWFGRDWNMRLSMLRDKREGLSEIDVDWGGACAKFRCDESWLAQIARSALGTDDENILQDEWRMIVMEAAFAEIATMIERATRKRFVLKSPTDQASAPEWEKFSVELNSGDQVSVNEIWLDQLGVGFLSNALRELPPALPDWSAWLELPIRVRFLVGDTRLPFTTLQKLGRRDVILLDQSAVNVQLAEVVVEFGGRYVATGTFAGRKITIADVLGKRMDEIDDGDLEQQEAYGDLLIKVSFDLGERAVSLSELLTIGPGHVFDLGRELRRAVFIRANGKVIGEGELVDIDGQVGIAVLRLDPPIPSER